MEVTIGSKVKHIPSGDIIIVKSKTKVFIQGIVKDQEQDWMCDKSSKVRITECEPYIEPPKEKSPYDQMRERNIEDAKKLPKSPTGIGQHLLWLKAAAIYRIETIDNRIDDKIYTFRQKVDNNEYGKFGFSENYLNLLMHYAYEAGKQNATDSLTRQFTESTKLMKNAIESIVHALDENDLLPCIEDNY
jgi:hypothetical protein